MLLHFIFVVKENELEAREKEFEYVKKMGQFYRVWIRNHFSKDFQIQCDQMITKPKSILHKLDTHNLIKDHLERGKDIYHFYLCHFRPTWTDCTCEGYFAENFGMVYWQKPKEENNILFLAEKNCSVVSHEIAHELLRKLKYKKYLEDVHEIWTRHFYANLPFEAYDDNFQKTNAEPSFLTIDLTSLNY